MQYLIYRKKNLRNWNELHFTWRWNWRNNSDTDTSPWLKSGGSIVYTAWTEFTRNSYWIPWIQPLPSIKWISRAFFFFQIYALTQPLSPMAETPVIHLRLCRHVSCLFWIVLVDFLFFLIFTLYDFLYKILIFLLF